MPGKKTFESFARFSGRDDTPTVRSCSFVVVKNTALREHEKQSFASTFAESRGFCKKKMGKASVQSIKVYTTAI